MKNKNTYEYLECPIVFSDFESMTKQQSVEYLEWFKSIVDDRISILSDHINSSGFSFEPDFSDNSLVRLWEWFEDNMVLVKKTKKELKKEKEGLPWFIADTIETKKLSSHTIAYCVDISFYFAKMIMMKSDNITWTRESNKKRNDYNRPILTGFKHKETMNPITIIINCAYTSVEEKNMNELLNTYHFWIKTSL